MNDLTQIVNLLSDDTIPLSSSLFKLKTFAHRIQNIKLAEWINKELDGYTNDKEVPQYRQFNCNIYSHITINSFRGMWQDKKFHVDPKAFPSKLRSVVDKVILSNSISSLEKLKEKKGLAFSIPPSALTCINTYYEDMGNEGFSTHSAWAEISITAIDDLLSQLRNTFLNLVLELENELGYEISLSEILSTKKETANNLIQNIMNQNNITSSGDGNLFNTGDNNQITQNVHIEKNNFEQLRKALKDNNIEDADIIELENIIDIEAPNIETNKFGNKVNNWITKMMSKALDGTWEISIGAAGGILAEAIMKYYGM